MPQNQKKHRKDHDLKDRDEFLSGFSSNDYLSSVITVVVYYGTKRWTGPRCHRDMFRLEEIPEEFHPYINDYPLHIIEAAHFDEPELFETDLKLKESLIQFF